MSNPPTNFSKLNKLANASSKPNSSKLNKLANISSKVNKNTNNSKPANKPVNANANAKVAAVVNAANTAVNGNANKVAELLKNPTVVAAAQKLVREISHTGGRRTRRSKR